MMNPLLICNVIVSAEVKAITKKIILNKVALKLKIAETKCKISICSVNMQINVPTLIRSMLDRSALAVKKDDMHEITIKTKPQNVN